MRTKFGVNVKQIKTIAANVDTLTLTATYQNFAVLFDGVYESYDSAAQRYPIDKCSWF
jgi:hypothetical protein